MMTYKRMTRRHLGENATTDDLRIFISLCVLAHQINTEYTEEGITAAVLGDDNDYLANARKLGVDVDALLAGYAVSKQPD